MSKHIIVEDGVPRQASQAAIMQHAIANLGGISFETLRRYPAADLAAIGIFLSCPTTNPEALQYQRRSSPTVHTDGSTAWFETTVSDIPLDDAKAQAIMAAAAKRWQVENGGTYLATSYLDTSREVRANYVHHNQKALDDPAHVITNWKIGPGTFINLDAATIQAATAAVEAHVQACYDKEASLVGEIVAAADMTALRAIDFDAGWPSNDPPEA